jgi:hypothetical protein
MSAGNRSLEPFPNGHTESSLAEGYEGARAQVIAQSIANLMMIRQALDQARQAIDESITALMATAPLAVLPAVDEPARHTRARRRRA